ncbi:MAG: TonB-dependent receptor [Gammaproteobacteria bacterium]|nr:TonB-dependent receptor [Gammaproteobacteria bacterium]
MTIGAHSVWAQDQSDEGESLSVDEVVVTARRAEERLLDVPLAVTAFTTEQIESQGIRNLDDIAALTPGLTFSNLIGEFLPVPVIRGVAPVNIFGENNAAIFVDGIYVSGREGLNFSQLDLQEINIVKGPQAALYGRNAFSGAINYVTAKPTSELRGKAEAQIGNDGKALGQFSVSGPVLGERLQGRLAVAYDRWDGSYTNRIANGPDIGGYEYKTAQASLRFATSERFEGLLSLYYSDDKIGPPAMSEVLANCENRNLVDPMQSSKWMNYCGKLPTVNADSLAVIAGADGEDRELTRVHLNLKWNVLGGTLTSLSGYSNTEQSYFEDGTRGTGIATYIYATTAPTPTTPRPIRTFQATLKQIGLGDTTEELSQELRFTSGERLRWSAGLYYYDTKAEGGNDGVIAAPALPSDFASFCPCVMITPTLGFPTPGASAGANATFIPWFTDPLGGAFPLAVRADVEAYSAFGSIDYDFTERLTGRVEARWTDESKESTTFNASGAVLRRFEDSWQIPNWRATVDFKPRTDVMFYGSIARAEKSGDFGTGTVRFVSDPNTQVTVGQPYDPEVLLAYELGFKGRFFDGRFQTEFDIFWNDWSDIVIPQVVTEVNGQPIVQPTSFEINAGDATVKGVEWSFVARLTPRLRINGGISLTNAEYDNARIQTFALFPSFAPDGNVSGNKILRQSEEQFTLGLGYEAPLRETLRWYLRSDLAYRGKQFADAANQIVVPEQTLLNTSIGLRGEQWQVELWGRNLTHEDAPTGAFRDVAFTNFAPNLPFAGGGSFFPFRLSVSHPRLTTYGVTVRFNF